MYIRRPAADKCHRPAYVYLVRPTMNRSPRGLLSYEPMTGMVHGMVFVVVFLHDAFGYVEAFIMNG